MSDPINAIRDEELAQVSGGTDDRFPIGTVYTTKVASGYLALRCSAQKTDGNIIAQLWNGSEVQIMAGVEGSFVYVYVNSWAPGPWGTDATGKVGYVDLNYLVPKTEA